MGDAVFAINVPYEYGFVILTVCTTWFLLNWLESRTLQARRKYEVPYPKMYIEPYSHEFNCIQRAHQNTLEGYPLFLILIVFGGVLYPKLSCVCGIMWIASRVVYTFDNYTGDPEHRKYGAFGSMGLFILFIFTIILALKIIGIIGS